MRRLTPFLFFVAAIGFILWLIQDHVFMFRLIFQDPPAILPIPVSGVSAGDLRDTWGEPRSEGRQHQGIDIFAPKGTPVLSATYGIVRAVGQNRLGGKTVRVLGPGGQIHYYAHLDQFADLVVNDTIAAGDVIGYVGNSGNARGTPPHLHYGIYTLTGQALNPFPLLNGPLNVAITKKVISKTKPTAVSFRGKKRKPRKVY